MTNKHVIHCPWAPIFLLPQIISATLSLLEYIPTYVNNSINLHSSRQIEKKKYDAIAVVAHPFSSRYIISYAIFVNIKNKYKFDQTNQRIRIIMLTYHHVVI